MIDNATAGINQWNIADKDSCKTALYGNLHLLQQSVGKYNVELNSFCENRYNFM